MRRGFTIGLVLAGCFFVHLLNGSSARGDDRARLAEFRELTSEQSEGRVSDAQAAEAQSAGSDSAPALVAPATNVSQPAATQPSVVVATSYAPRVNVPTPVYIQPPPPSGSFYAGASARATLSQFPRRAAIQPSGPRPIRRQVKPFQGREPEPTLSPYLNLDRDDDDSQNAPSFLTIVRPQMQQMQANQTNQRELQQLRNQVQSMASGYSAPSQYEPGRGDGMAFSARYMDTAQFYKMR